MSPSTSDASTPTFDKPLKLPLSQEELDRINAYLRDLTPEQILTWAVEHIPGLYQTTAFGLTGLVAIDMLSKITENPPPLIFIDTLYHFPETYELVEEVKKRYNRDVHVYKPEGCETVEDFEKKFGQKFWEADETTYDYVVKVEPARRAYEELGVKAVITGRRASQGADRANLQPLEVDSTGLLKLNPLFSWTFPFVQWYVDTNKVPRNKLLDQGYRSVGDWHSTAKSADGDQGERAGRWAGKAEKTECGLHVDYFKMKAAAEAKVRSASDSRLPRKTLGEQAKESAPAASTAPAVQTSA
ncbi:phosphoadenylyl-sulfate reductase [Cubamyces menziesii]|nr:phosphoadenylyl-sulfate reductase [Cubamyces menziesii]